MGYRPLKTILFSSAFMLALGCWRIVGTAMAEGPSFDCSKASGSGSKYQGRNESFWEHHGEAIVVWGYGNPEMRCKKR